MIIGVPKEIKIGESRVALSPVGVRRLVGKGHQILFQAGAGQASGWSDAEYRKAGVRIIRDAAVIYRRAALICKVKEPQAGEMRYLRAGQVLFTFLHLAGDHRLLRRLQQTGITALAYETVATVTGELPILEPMSDIAGRMAAQLGAGFLRYGTGGKGKLLSPVAGSAPGSAVIIGCGHVGRAALASLVGLGADVTAVDIDKAKLNQLSKHYGKRLKTCQARSSNIARLLRRTDLLIGAVLVAAHRAPHVVSRGMVRHMQRGSVIVDVAIDQGGCVATSHPTNIDDPTFLCHNVVHCAVPNLPALVPQTASGLLSERVLPYLQALADRGWERACKKNAALKAGLNLVNGKIVHPALL